MRINDAQISSVELELPTDLSILPNILHLCCHLEHIRVPDAQCFTLMTIKPENKEMSSHFILM